MDDYGDIDDAAFTAVADAAEKAHASTSTANAPGPSTTKVVQPVPRKIVKAAGPSSIIVNTRQKGNPLLPYIKIVPWEYGDIVADYLVTPTSCVLFLSLKYHRLHPEYIYTRIKSLGYAYTLRILLILADTEQHTDPLKELTRAGLIHNLTVIVAWSAAEAGRYVELYKSMEHAPATMIKERQREDYMGQVEEFVTSVRGVNKTDALGLISMFGSLKAAVNASEAQISLIPGWGEKKTKRWCTAVREDFRVGGAMGKRRREAEEEDSMDTSNSMGQAEQEALNRRMGLRGTVEVKKEVDFDMVIDIDADEEAALLAMEEEERTRKAPQASKPAPAPLPVTIPSTETSTTPSKPEDGVMAALAKLRKQ